MREDLAGDASLRLLKSIVVHQDGTRSPHHSDQKQISLAFRLQPSLAIPVYRSRPRHVALTDKPNSRAPLNHSCCLYIEIACIDLRLGFWKMKGHICELCGKEFEQSRSASAHRSKCLGSVTSADRLRSIRASNDARRKQQMKGEH